MKTLLPTANCMKLYQLLARRYASEPETYGSSDNVHYFAMAINGKQKQEMDLLIVKNCKPAKARLEKLIREEMGEGWELDWFWCPEPKDEF